MIGLFSSQTAFTHASMLLAGSAEQYMGIARTIQMGLTYKSPPQEIARQIVEPYQALGVETHPAYMTAHTLLGQIVRGGQAEVTHERLTLALGLIPISARIEQLGDKDTLCDELETNIPPISNSPLRSFIHLSQQTPAAPPVTSQAPADLALIDALDDANESAFLTRLLQVSEGPLAHDLAFLNELGPQHLNEQHNLGNGYFSAGTNFDASLVEVMHALLRGTFIIPVNPGPIPNQAWANHVNLVPTLLEKISEDRWQFNLNVDFELELADPNHLLLIMLNKSHLAYETITETSYDESNLPTENDSRTKIKIKVRYQGAIDIQAHAIRIKLSVFEDPTIEKGFTREEFGDLELVFMPQGLVLTMEEQPFSVNPQNFVRAIKEGIEAYLLQHPVPSSDTIRSTSTLPSAGNPDK